MKPTQLKRRIARAVKFKREIALPITTKPNQPIKLSDWLVGKPASVRKGVSRGVFQLPKNVIV